MCITEPFTGVQQVTVTVEKTQVLDEGEEAQTVELWSARAMTRSAKRAFARFHPGPEDLLRTVQHDIRSTIVQSSSGVRDLKQLDSRYGHPKSIDIFRTLGIDFWG